MNAPWGIHDALAGREENPCTKRFYMTSFVAGLTICVYP
jgi:hypothetical protein